MSEHELRPMLAVRPFAAGAAIAGFGFLLAVTLALARQPELWTLGSNPFEDGLGGHQVRDAAAWTDLECVNEPEVADSSLGRGSRQHAYRRCERRRLEALRALAQQRRRIFLRGLSRIPPLEDARVRIAEEDAVLRDLDRRLETLTIQPMKDAVPGWSVAIVLTVVICAATSHLLERHARSVAAFREARWTIRWRRAYGVFTASLFLVAFGREVWTSVLTVDKTWFAWSSYYVCPPAWWSFRLMDLGLAMVVAWPLALGWALGARRFAPTAYDPNATDGAWGVGDYVFFLHTWTVSVFLLALLPFLFWANEMREQGERFSLWYAARWILIGALLASVAVRFLRRAIDVRLHYQSKLASLKPTWTEIAELQPPPDPTRRLLGEHWWALPATILGALAIAWQAFKTLGLTGFLPP